MVNNHHHHHHMLKFNMPHLHLCHHDHRDKKFGEGHKDVPKGCLAVRVGRGEEEQRFVIPVMYLNHPLFKELLKEAEEEYGFHQKGLITIPCPVEEFRTVHAMIDQDKSSHHHNHPGWCFRV